MYECTIRASKQGRSTRHNLLESHFVAPVARFLPFPGCRNEWVADRSPVAEFGVWSVHVSCRRCVADGMCRVPYTKRKGVVSATIRKPTTAPRSPGASIVAEAIARNELQTHGCPHCDGERTIPLVRDDAECESKEGHEDAGWKRTNRIGILIAWHGVEGREEPRVG